MIAIDTNILIYAHQQNSNWHQKSKKILEDLANSSNPWCIPWPCIFEFLAIVTNPRIFSKPTPLKIAVQQINDLLTVPSLRLIAESDQHWSALKGVLLSSQVLGAQMHDAKIYSICLSHGVAVLYSADRDMSRFAGLEVVNPLIS